MLPIELLDGGEWGECGAGVVKIEVPVRGECLKFYVKAVDGGARLSDIVPVARAISDKITAEVIRVLKEEDYVIPCEKGCGSCCTYLVPLSVPEALRLIEEIEKKNAAYREVIKESFLVCAARILKKEPPRAFVENSETKEGLRSISDWYRDIQLTCPFLMDDVCVLYSQRPLACREHFVTGSSKGCMGERSNGQVVRLPIRMAEVLTSLAARMEGLSPETVIMPLVTAWHDQNGERGRRTYSAIEMVEAFAELVDAQMGTHYGI